MKNDGLFVVHVIPSDSGGGAENLVGNLLDFEKDSFQTSLYFSSNSLKSKREKSTYLGYGAKNLLNIFALRRTIKSILRDHDNLIVHSHLTWPLFYVPIGLFGLKVKLVYTEHSTHNKRRRFSFFRYIDRLFYSRYLRIIAISDSVARSLERWLGQKTSDRIVVINNGANFYNFKTRFNLDSEKKIKLLSVGSLKTLKGFDTTIKAIADIASYIDNYTIVGVGPSHEYLKIVAKEYKVDHLIKFVGWSNDLENFYHDADILLIPSHWEGFGLCAVEGMSTGLPVIASNVNGLNEVVAESLSSSILVDDYLNVDLWSSSILEMREKLTSDFYSMSIESQEQASKFSIKKMFSAYEDLYRGL